MEEASGDVGVVKMTETPGMFYSGEYNGGNVRLPTAETTPLTVSGSFNKGEVGGGRGSGTPSRRRASVKPSLDADELMNLLHESNPVKLEPNQLENEVRDKDRELGERQAEIKSPRLSERLREKTVEELTEELSKVDERLKLTEYLLESKNLEIKKINDEKKASMAAQFAAEATLRRVHDPQQKFQFQSQNLQFPPQNLQFPSQNFQPQSSQYPPHNFSFHPYQFPQSNSSPVLTSDHESGNHVQTTSSNSLGRIGLGNMNLNDDHDEAVKVNRERKGMKKKKWTQDLNLTLVSCWLSISKDPVVGNQSSDSYWQRITNKFNKITGESRTVGQCKTQWSKSSAKVKYFSGCYKRAKDLHHSTWNEDDYMEEAHKFYKQKKGKNFTLIYWWNVVKKEGKWNNKVMEEQASKKIKTNDSGAYTTSSGGNTNEEIINCLQPTGQKVAKINKGKGKLADVEEFSQNLLDVEARKTKVLEKMVEAQKALADAQKAQADAQKAQADAQKFNAVLEFLSKDTSNMSDDQRARYERVCDMLRAQYFNF